MSNSKIEIRSIKSSNSHQAMYHFNMNQHCKVKKRKIVVFGKIGVGNN